MVSTRAAKVAKAADDIPAQTVWGDPEATCSSWDGAERGHLQNAVDQMRAEGKRVSLAATFQHQPAAARRARHLREIRRRIVVCELNEGQFANLRQNHEFKHTNSTNARACHLYGRRTERKIRILLK